jgi:hypothetical protein
LNHFAKICFKNRIKFVREVKEVSVGDSDETDRDDEYYCGSVETVEARGHCGMATEGSG